MNDREGIHPAASEPCGVDCRNAAKLYRAIGWSVIQIWPGMARRLF